LHETAAKWTEEEEDVVSNSVGGNEQLDTDVEEVVDAVIGVSAAMDEFNDKEISNAIKKRKRYLV
jgi:hypothetical protein